MNPTVLSVHAVDNLGREGVLVDAAVCSELQCRPLSVVTSILTARGAAVEALEGASLAMVAQQFEALMSDCRPSWARTGILHDARQVELVATLLSDYAFDNLVVAPPAHVGKTRILDESTCDATRRLLFPLARLVVARAVDLQVLAGEVAEDVEGMKSVASALRAEGARSVLIAGVATGGRVLDLLDDEGRIGWFDSFPVPVARLGGRAGAHVAALTAQLALGQPLPRAVKAAARYVGFRLQRGRSV